MKEGSFKLTALFFVKMKNQKSGGEILCFVVIVVILQPLFEN